MYSAVSETQMRAFVFFQESADSFDPEAQTSLQSGTLQSPEKEYVFIPFQGDADAIQDLFGQIDTPGKLQDSKLKKEEIIKEASNKSDKKESGEKTDFSSSSRPTTTSQMKETRVFSSEKPEVSRHADKPINSSTKSESHLTNAPTLQRDATVSKMVHTSVGKRISSEKPLEREISNLKTSLSKILFSQEKKTPVLENPRAKRDIYDRQKEKDQKGGNPQEQKEERESKKREKGLKVDKSAQLDQGASSTATRVDEENAERSGSQQSKPTLEAPSIFLLSFHYDKLEVNSVGFSYSQYKDELRANEEEETAAHRNHLAELKKAIEKKRHASRWGMMAKVMSWIGSIMGIVAGVGLIATGIGSVAGALLIVGGVVQLTNEIMEVTGAWNKIAEILPGDDPDKKRAVATWMQIGLGVTCLILGGLGIIFGGFGAFGEAAQGVLAVFGGITLTGQGIAEIGRGICEGGYYKGISKSKAFEIKLDEAKFRREDLMDWLQGSIERLEKIFETLSENLKLLDDIYAAEQAAWR